MKKVNERSEALMRIPVCIISGVIFYFWTLFIEVLVLVNFLVTLFTGKRNKDLAQLGEVWATHTYAFIRYMLFSTNKRPFPFTPLQKKTMDKFEK